MNCPKCTGTELFRGKMKRAPDVELDGCPKCGGLWFDAGELGAVLGPVAQRRAQIPAHAKVNERLRCPRCGDALAWFCFPGSTTVIDACRGCQGVWLDAGEAKSLQAALESSLDRMTCPKCHAVQPKGMSCAVCGIIIERYQTGHGAPAAPQRAPSSPQSRPPPPAAVPARRGGGIKEALLAFIEDALSGMLS